MGGRGSSSARRNAIARNAVLLGEGGKEDKSEASDEAEKDTPSGVLDDEQLKQIAGEKGISDSVQGATHRTNPHFDEDRKWQENCQRCVIAYEMRRRGYDVEAKSAILEDFDPLMSVPQAWRQVFDGTESVKLEKTPKVKLTQEEKAQAEEAGISSSVVRAAKRLGAQMAKWGTGARAMEYVVWKNGTGAHVFIAEQTSEGTKYVDPQNGRMLAVGDYLSKAILEKAELIRIDQAKPTGLLEEAVQKREKEKK